MPQIEISRDKDGFLKCQYCPRRFFIKTGFKIHSIEEHKNDNVTQLDQMLRIPPKKDESASQKDNGFEINVSSLGRKIELEINVSPLGRKIKLEQHINAAHNNNFKIEDVNKNPSPHQCKECNKVMTSKRNLQNHINIVHKKIKQYKCQECKAFFGVNGALQVHINSVHRKLKPHQCQECKKYFGNKYHLKLHINTVHKKLKPHQCQKCKRTFGLQQNLRKHKICL